MTPLFQFILLALAAYRITRFISRDDWPPIAWLREKLVTRWSEPVISAGDDKVSWADGLLCFWCIGTVVSFALVLSLAAVRPVPLSGLQAFGVATIVGFLGSRDG